MAKGHKQSKDKMVQFVTAEELLNQKSQLPNLKGRHDAVATEENRDYLSEVVGCALRAFRQRPVQSNTELLHRLEEYITILEGRRVPPTVEELALYIGYGIDDFGCLVSGQSEGWHDQPYPGVTTSELLKKAMTILHMIDATLAEKRVIDATTYIFRAKNYYGMQDRRELDVVAKSEIPDALPPEQIAKLLPELPADASLDDVEII